MGDATDIRARVTANLMAARARIASAAMRAGRSPDDVRLIAVSKTFDADHVRAAYDAGQRDFGENKVQEALAKRDATADLDITWHLIGHLQSNKARKTGGAFAWIHSVDSVDLLQRIDRAARETDSRPRLLIQVDLAGEATKFGAPVEAVRPILDAATRCEAAVVSGLMLLPPWSDDPEASRPWFRRLRDLRDTLVAEGRPPASLSELSMGMSHDCEVAVEEGATMVRIGTAIFGARPPAG
jgi:pyridoxal phosphate enzyme (YggS family)